MVAVFQPNSGFVLAEGSITAHVNGACDHGAEIHGHEKMIGWEANWDGYAIQTPFLNTHPIVILSSVNCQIFLERR
jgi:hypothetical protein